MLIEEYMSAIADLFLIMAERLRIEKAECSDYCNRISTAKKELASFINELNDSERKQRLIEIFNKL